MVAPLPYADHLLPVNATHLEQTVAGAARRILAIPAPIDTEKDPTVPPIGFVPWLAWEYSVDIWHPDRWNEPRRRTVAARSEVMHTRKGTAWAVREWARYEDATVRSIERPPMQVFSGPSPTRAEREAWLSSLPQVRVWRIQESWTAPNIKTFLGGGLAGTARARSPRFCLPGRSYGSVAGSPSGLMLTLTEAETVAPVKYSAFSTPSTALTRLKRRARWVVAGVETEIRVSSIGNWFRLHLPKALGLRVFCDTRQHGRFFVPSDAWSRLYTVQPTPRQAWRAPVTPTLEPATAEPERVTVSGMRSSGVFCDVPMRRGFYRPTTAPLRIFQRYAVADGRPLAHRPACQIMGLGRYGFPAHTAYVSVSVPGRAPRWAAGRGFYQPRARYWIPHDPSRVIAVRRAIDAARRASDRILLKLGPERRFVAGGDPVLAGVDTVIVGRP